MMLVDTKKLFTWDQQIASYRILSEENFNLLRSKPGKKRYGSASDHVIQTEAGEQVRSEYVTDLAASQMHTSFSKVSMRSLTR